MNFFGKKSLCLTTAFVIAAIGALLYGGILKNPFQHPLDPRLVSPLPLFQELLKTKSPLFLTPEFIPLFASWPASQKNSLPSLAEARAASRDKSVFWGQNREKHYGAVFLGISPDWQELFDSLVHSQLWVLSDVSPWGFLFLPENAQTTEWKIPTDTELLKEWPLSNDRARFLILTAGNLAAINHRDDAEHLLALAEELHLYPSLLQSTRASLAATHGDWEIAAKFARQSLHSDHSNSAAREILIRALVEKGNTDEALDQARELSVREPENEAALFLLARAASAANSGKEEIEALSRLVSVARSKGEPIGSTLTYLGQAYAKQGDRGDALRSFQMATLAPELSDEQHKMIRDMMDHIMEGNRSSSSLPPLQNPAGSNP